jgi:hypothetical protein
MPVELDRRAFLSGAGAAFLLGLSPARAERLAGARTLFVTGFMDAQRRYGFAILDDAGKLVYRHEMPGRAHGFTFSPATGMAVGFARRPGNFAIAFRPLDPQDPSVFMAPEGRHFYGHGTFSQDGRLLYATENDYEAGEGRIGIYDATDDFHRIGQFDSHGVGPHEMILMRDGRTLAIANGGIRTHPDFGRAKLNLAQMQSRIVLIDSRDGAKRASFALPSDYARMSLRHMVHAGDGSLWIGGQFEGDRFAAPSPVSRLDENGALTAISLPETASGLLSGYVGAVALSADGSRVGFSSPRGGGIAIFDTASARLADLIDLPRTSGLAGSKTGFAASSEDGRFANTCHDVSWDNHIWACRTGDSRSG